MASTPTTRAYRRCCGSWARIRPRSSRCRRGETSRRKAENRKRKQKGRPTVLTESETRRIDTPLAHPAHESAECFLLSPFCFMLYACPIRIHCCCHGSLNSTIRFGFASCGCSSAEELSVGEFVRALQLPQSTVSRHLKMLHAGAWAIKRSEGTASLYRVVEASLSDTFARNVDAGPEAVAGLADARLCPRRCAAGRRAGGACDRQSKFLRPRCRRVGSSAPRSLRREVHCDGDARAGRSGVDHRRHRLWNGQCR